MPDKEQSSLFLEQIIESTLEDLSKDEAFDKETMHRLRKLANSSSLTSFERVVEALVGGEGS